MNWHKKYVDSLSPGERVAQKFTDYLFSISSVVVHVVVYAVLMYMEGGDFHLFLDGISIEAIFASLMIGIGQKAGTKRDKVAQEQRDHMQGSIEQLLEINNKQTDEIHEITVRKAFG